MSILNRNIFLIVLTIFLFFNCFTFGQSIADSIPPVKRDSAVVLIINTNNLKIILGKDTLPAAASDTTLKETATKLVTPSISELISLSKVIWTIVFFLIGYYIIKIISIILDKFAERSAKYRITIKGIVPVVRIFGWTVLIYIIIAGVFKPPVETIIAVTASVGIAVGFAAQDIIKNIFGGIMILFDRPFQVGDKIDIGNYYGEVVKIGLRSTRIVTADDSLVAIPNSVIMNQSVSNSNSGEPNCQVVAEIYLPITVDTEKVRQIALEAAQVSRYIYMNKPISVLFFNEVKERRSYFKMRLKAYVMDIRYEFAFKSDMNEIVIRELLKQKILSPQDIF